MSTALTDHGSAPSFCAVGTNPSYEECVRLKETLRANLCELLVSHGVRLSDLDVARGEVSVSVALDSNPFGAPKKGHVLVSRRSKYDGTDTWSMNIGDPECAALAAKVEPVLHGFGLRTEMSSALPNQIRFFITT